MNAPSLLPLVLAAVTFYVGASNLLIFAKRPRDREYLTMAASCLFFAMYDLCCALLYNVSSAAQGGMWQRWQGVSLALATASFAWFLYDYLKAAERFTREMKIATGVMSACFVALALLMAVERSGLFWIMDLPLVKTVRLPFGVSLVYHEVTPGPLTNLQSVMGFLSYGFFFLLIIRAYRRGARDLAIPLIVVLSIFLAAMISDTAVSLGLYPFVYTMEYAYMVMVLNITNSLTRKVVRSGITEEALRASHARFRSLVEASNDWIWEVDVHGVFTYSSPKVSALLGYAPEEVTGRSILELMPAAEAKRLRDGFIRITTKPIPVENIEYVCVRKDGGTAVMEASAVPLLGGQGELKGYQGITRDVTGRKASEEDLRRHARQLEALRQLGLQLTAELDLNQLLRSVISRALELLGAGSGGVYLFNPDKDALEWKIGVGPVLPPPGNSLRRGEGLPGRVWECGQTLAVSDYAFWEGPGGQTPNRPKISSMGAAVRWGEEFFGILYIIGDGARIFSGRELQLLDLFASQAAIAIRNARLYEAASSRAERLSVVNRIASAVGAALALDDLLETVYRETVALFTPDAFFIALHDEKSHEIELRFRVEDGFIIAPEKVPVGDGMASRVISGRKPLFIRDIRKEAAHPATGLRDGGKHFRSWLGVPMLLEDRVIGIISVQSYKTAAFGRDDVELLQTVAEQVAAAVERARLYQILRDSEEEYRTLFEQAMDAVILHGPDGRILDVNPRACELLGYGRAELLGLSAPDIAAPGSPLGAAARAAVPDARIESEYVRKDGARVPVEASIARLAVAGKTVTSVVAHDISQRKKVEGRLRQAQKMEAVGTLAGGVAHDFNNILTGILGYSSLLRQELAPGSQSAADVEAIAGSARRAAELTQQLLTFSRRSPKVETAPVDVNGVVKEIAFLLGRTFDKSITVETVLDPREPAVEGNAGQLHQAILNLCLNARDAMPRGGRLRIQTGERGRRVFIRVSDTGTGMLQAVRDHLFEPFFTTKESGRGLGLAMVYGIVRGHDGEITVQSEPGAGTTFEIGLPLSDRKPASAPAPAAPSRRRGSETVLVVDDEETVRSVLKRILEREGYTVMLAEDGIEGVRKFRADPRAVSLVILDMAMPRMDGSEAFEAIYAVDPDARVLVSSGYSEEGRAAELLRKGAKGFLRKPYSNDGVLDAVRGILDA